MNFVDLVFLLLVTAYAVRGFRRGFVKESLDFMGFLVGLFAALRFNFIPAAVLKLVRIPDTWAKVIGGLLIFFFFVTGAAILAGRLHRAHKGKIMTRPFRVGGIFFGGAWAVLLGVVLLITLSVLPIARSTQKPIAKSLVGKTVLHSESPVYEAVEDFAQKDIRNLLYFLRQYVVQLDPPKRGPGGEEFFTLNPSNDIKLAPDAEVQILNLVNKERRARGLGELRPHSPIRGVARKHSADMYRRGYFAHRNPDGKDPFDRMADGGIRFTVAGENLALAPSVEMVHQGLMNSPRHRDNILKPDFTDLGVGVYEGPYGLMVTQNFCAGCT